MRLLEQFAPLLIPALSAAAAFDAREPAENAIVSLLIFAHYSAFAPKGLFNRVQHVYVRIVINLLLNEFNRARCVHMRESAASGEPSPGAQLFH